MVQYFCWVDTHTPDPKYSYTVSYTVSSHRPLLASNDSAVAIFGVNNRHMPMFIYAGTLYQAILQYVGESIYDYQVQSVCTSSIT